MRKPRLGQHFLTRAETARHVAQSVPVPQSGVVLEVGPGRGILTRELLQIANTVVAIEKDAELVQRLEGEFMDECKNGRLVLLQEDIRDFSPEQSSELKDGYAVIANIPYYITGRIIRMFLTATLQPESMAVLIQKEVAERIVAKNGKQSILSLSVALYGTPKYVRTVKAGAFSPVPNVDSAILAIRNISRKQLPNMNLEERYFELLHTAFAQKRKTLGASLKGVLHETEYKACSVSIGARPEDVPLESWLCLCTA